MKSDGESESVIDAALRFAELASGTHFPELPRQSLGAVPDPVEEVWVYLDRDDLMVAWNAYRGVFGVVGGGRVGYLSSFTASRIRASFGRTGAPTPPTRTFLQAEAHLEIFRRDHFPNCASRLRSVFAFADHSSAIRARAWNLPHFTESNLTKVGIWPGSTFCKRDAQWISAGLLSEDSSWYPSYLDGEPKNDTPIWEVVIEGKVTVLSGAFRTSLRETLRAAEPDSVLLIELARVGGEIGSDTGAAAQYIMAGESGVRIRSLVNVGGLDDPAWNAAYAAYSGPRDLEALSLSPDSDTLFTVPDWRYRDLWIPR